MPTSERPAETRLRPEYAARRPFRPGRAIRRRADHGASRPRLCRTHVLQGLLDHRRARSEEPAPGKLSRRAARHLEHPPADPRRSAAGHQRQGHVRRRRIRRREGQLGKVVGTADANTARARDWTAGLAVYDISSPAEPRRIGFMPVEGGGIHRVWYTGGRWAYASALIDGFTDYIFIT